MSARCIVVVGPDEYSRPCGALAAEVFNEVITIAARRISGTAAFDISALEAYPPGKWSAFAAVGSELLNLSRLSLMSQLVAAGYEVEAIASARASLQSGLRLERNVLVCAGAIIGHNTIVRHNVVIGAGAVIGNNVSLGHSVWIGAGSILGDRVRIDDGTIIGPGAVVAEGVSIGRQCEVSIGQMCIRDIPARTLSSPAFDEAARVHPLRA